MSPASGAFQYKWNAKWTEDTLAYFREDPIYRLYQHDRLTSGLKSTLSGAFLLPLIGNGPLIDRMPGDDWRKLANLRLLYGYLTACTGKKLLTVPVEWVGQPPRDGPHRWLRDLNTFYRGQPALYELDSDAAGFAWVDANDRERSILAFRRMGRDSQNQVLFLFNFTPVPRQNYRAGVPQRGEWRELLNGDATLYGGSGQGNLGSIVSAPVPMHGYPDSLNLTLPPLAMLALQKASEVDE